MINVFTDVDISYELEPASKIASLLLKGSDWKSRNLCKEKQKNYDKQRIDHMNNCIG